MGIPQRREVGKYLGNQIATSSKNMERHRDLLRRVQLKVAGWKTHYLSRAGRLTLAKSVLDSLPVFEMQMEHLPDWVHKELDKAVRRCVWGLDGDRRGVHLLDWMTLCRSKRSGGAGLRPAREINQAMLAKLAWRILSCRGELWREVVCAK